MAAPVAAVATTLLKDPQVLQGALQGIKLYSQMQGNKSPLAGFSGPAQGMGNKSTKPSLGLKL